MVSTVVWPYLRSWPQDAQGHLGSNAPPLRYGSLLRLADNPHPDPVAYLRLRDHGKFCSDGDKESKRAPLPLSFARGH